MTVLFDSEQDYVIAEIKKHLSTLLTPRARSIRMRSFIKNSSLKSIYVYGPVGRGKTTLIHHIFNDLPFPKQKYHFDHFAAEIYQKLQKMSMSELLDNLYTKGRIIWIDELQIYDIGTAMLLKRLVPAMIKHKMIILMTGNVEPINFYKDGLNRDQFEGFIPFFYENFFCFPLNGKEDYRRLSRNKVTQHFWIKSEQSMYEMEMVFSSLSPDELQTPFNLMLNQRSWHLTKTIGAAVFLDFVALAEENHAALDYKMLINTFPILFIHSVPVFNDKNRDACRRFMAFVDILYDAHGTLFMELPTKPDQLYQDVAQKLPFERTASRLNQLLHMF